LRTVQLIRTSCEEVCHHITFADIMIICLSSEVLWWNPGGLVLVWIPLCSHVITVWFYYGSS